MNECVSCQELLAKLALCFRHSGASPIGKDFHSQADFAADAVRDLREEYDELLESSQPAMDLMHKLDLLPDGYALVKTGGKWIVMESGRGFDPGNHPADALKHALQELMERSER